MRLIGYLRSTLGSHRADHGPKHEPGEDLIVKGHKITAFEDLRLALSKIDRRGKLPPSTPSPRRSIFDRSGPVTEVLTLAYQVNPKRSCGLSLAYLAAYVSKKSSFSGRVLLTY